MLLRLPWVHGAESRSQGRPGLLGAAEGDVTKARAFLLLEVLLVSNDEKGTVGNVHAKG